MTLKSKARRLLLAPIWPRVFIAELAVLRFLKLLPQRIQPKWPPERVLIVNITGNLGDILMMLPLVDRLHASLPEASIDLIVQPPMDVPLRAIPFVRRVFRFDRDVRSIPLIGHYHRVYRMVRFARRELMSQPYDLALLPRWGTDPSLSSYLAAMSTAPRRAGHNQEEDNTAEPVLPGMAALLTDVSNGGKGLAEGVREQLLLLACGLAGEFDRAREEQRPVKSVVELGRTVDFAACTERLGLPLQRPFILLCPGASHPVRCWPPERFAALGIELHRRTGLPVYCMGGPPDRPLCEHVAGLSGGSIRSLAGDTSVLEAVALAQHATLLVSNDSGPAHVGGSVGTPTLVLSACPKTSTEEHANSPLRVRPVGPKVRVLQPDQSAPGCTNRCLGITAHCILGLTVDSVLSAALQMVESSEGSVGDLRMDRITDAGAPAATL